MSPPRCPGQDTRYWTADDAFDIKCPHCGHEMEFFNVGGLRKADSLVREVIQNSLDARLPGQGTIRVRFTFGEDGNSDGKYYDGLISHLKSCDLLPPKYHSMQESLPSMQEAIPFLTIEDFGTSGLDGPTDPDGGTYAVGDTAGYLLYGHDRTGDATAGPAVNYVSIKTAKYFYTCEADGTIHQWDAVGGTEYTD